MSLDSEKRKEKIKELIEKRGSIAVSELVRIFNVSEVTIRKELEQLKKEGILVRTYGGALKSDIIFPENLQFKAKLKKNIREKRIVAEMAIKYIKEGEAIFLDSGTTTLEIAKLICEKNLPVTVITNSLPAINYLVNSSTAQLISLSGFFRKESFDFYGPFTIEEIRKLSFTGAFIGVDGISGETGLTTTDVDTARIEEVVIEKAREINIVVDYSKIGKISPVPYGEMLKKKKDKRIITDYKASKKEIEKLKKYGFEIIIGEKND